MISLILAAAVSCTVTLPPGTHNLTCRAEYLHTLPSGETYTSTKTHNFWMPIPMNATCSGEGSPERVTMKDGASIICGAEAGIFKDGFESGDTSEWSHASP